MKRHFILLCLICFFSLSPFTESVAETETGEEDKVNYLETPPPETPNPEDWKWSRPTHEWEFGALTGLEILDGAVGFPINLTAAYRLDKDGWIKDINNQIFAELMMGPLFISGEVAFSYSLHLRWNFFRTHSTGYYAVLGLGGLFSGSNLGSRNRIYPRLALGLLQDVGGDIFLRVEVSQELIGTGVVICL